MADTFQLEIVTPEKMVVSDTAEEMQIPGKNGYLGILPGHAPLITELAVGEITYRKGGQTHYLSVAWGFAEVLPDKVTILAESCRAPGGDRCHAGAGGQAAGRGTAEERQAPKWTTIAPKMPCSAPRPGSKWQRRSRPSAAERLIVQPSHCRYFVSLPPPAQSSYPCGISCSRDSVTSSSRLNFFNRTGAHRV